MSEEDRLQSILTINESESHFISLMTEYEELLEQRYELLQKAVITKLLSLYRHLDYVYSTRLLYSTYIYHCGMLGERCTRLILSLDGVLSYGDSTIKQRRKDLIVRVQRFQQYVDVLVERSKSLQNWFTECSLSPIQRLEYDIITQSEQEP
ncbi:hypothetical protein WA171_006494, partial [Blastocystis sp. BT1]